MMCINRIKKWWKGNCTDIKHCVNAVAKKNIKWVRRIARFTCRMILIGVIINVISNCFYPEFIDRFPAIYGWFDGWVQFGEFTIKSWLAGTYALFTGNGYEFWIEYNEALWELVHQLGDWLSSLSF